MYLNAPSIVYVIPAAAARRHKLVRRHNKLNLGIMYVRWLGPAGWAAVDRPSSRSQPIMGSNSKVTPRHNKNIRSIWASRRDRILATLEEMPSFELRVALNENYL